MISTNIYDPQALLDPYPVYRILREQDQGLAFHDYAKSWLVTSYQAVREVSMHRDISIRFRDRPHHIPEEIQVRRERINDFLNHWVTFSDPPDHGTLRNALGMGFRPKTIQAMEPRIQASIDRFFDGIDGQAIDLIKDLVYPLTLGIIADLLDMPATDRSKVQEWMWRCYHYMGDHSGVDLTAIEGMEATLDAVVTYFQATMARRSRAEANDDFMSILSKNYQHEKVTRGQMIANYLLLMIAGQDTTVNLLGNAIDALLKHPDQLGQLRKQSELLECAVEELLRFDTSTQFVMRYAPTEVTIAGKVVPADSRLLVFLGSANHDPAIFERPDQLILERNPNDHVSFGYGRHFCLGAALARLEITCLLRSLLQRFSTWSYAGEPKRRLIPSLRGFETFPIVFKS